MRMIPLYSLVPVLLSACQSSVPLEIRQPAFPPLSAVEVQANPKLYVGKPIRWGGRIVAIENKSNDTWIEILNQELDEEGRPQRTDQSFGRFLASAGGFLDPAVYRARRQVTVYGVLEPPVNRAIGERPYTYPMVRAQKVFLWPDYGEQWRNRPYYYDPFYYPYYPYYPYWNRFRFGIYNGWW